MSADGTRCGPLGTIWGPVRQLDESWSNTDLVEKLVDIVTQWDPIILVVDQRSAAAVVKLHLADVGIDAHMTNASELALACGGFLDDALAGRLSHSGQEISNATCRAAATPGPRRRGGSSAQLMVQRWHTGLSCHFRRQRVHGLAAAATRRQAGSWRPRWDAGPDDGAVLRPF